MEEKQKTRRKAKRLGEITLYNLEEVLVKHSYEFQEATDDLPHLRRMMSEAKVEMERAKASLYLQIRKAYQEANEKFTEGVLNSEVETHPSYMKKQREFLEAREAYDIVDNLKEVYLQRESTLKLLVGLYASQYWSLSGIETVPQAKEHSEGSRFKERK